MSKRILPAFPVLALALVTSTAQAQQATPAPTVIPEVTVTATASPYVAPTSTTGTKLDTPQRDIPQTINVVPKEVLKDRGVVRVAEAADNVPGVQFSTGYGGLSSGSFFIRGFDSQGTFRDGFKDFGFISPADVAGIERIEFLKGPASVLYGQSQPGGIVNYVSKRPIPTSLTELGFTYGSYDLYRATADLGGTLVSRSVPGTVASEKNPKAPVFPGSEPVLMYRLNMAYENAGSHRDYNDSESFYIAPSLTWIIGPDTTLTLFGEYQKYDYVFDRGLLPVRQTFQVPISRFIGEPENHAEAESFRLGYEFIHHFGDDWQFRSAFAAIASTDDSLFSQPSELAADGHTVLRSDTDRSEQSKNYTLQNELSGKFHTGSVEHHALLGLELARYEFGYNIGFGRETSIDLFHPVYGVGVQGSSSRPREDYGADNLGVYFQDQVTLTSQLKLLAGVRYDYLESFYDSSSGVDNQTDNAFTPRAGIVYQPWEPVSLFFGWSRSFNPNTFAVSASGESFDPEEGEQFEAGVKLELIKDRLTSTISVYDITKQNVAVTDPDNVEFSILTGEQKSRGAEFDLTGSITPGWNVIVSYAYTDAYVSKDTVLPEGARLAGVPKQQAGLWTSYELQDGKLKGFGIGAGVFYAGDRPAALPSEGVNLPSYVRFDASLFYHRDNWSAQVNFKNITDENIYQSQGYLIVPDAGFNVQASVTYKF